MGTEIAWIPEWVVTPGASLESVRAVLEEMVTSAQGEPGTLSYAVYVSEDGQTIIFYERYADEAAVLAHQTHFAERFAERAQDAGMTCSRITVLGSPGEEVRKSISGCGPIYLEPFGGFSAR
jgi:quinol monooxygenase YgiN